MGKLKRLRKAKMLKNKQRNGIENVLFAMGVKHPRKLVKSIVKLSCDMARFQWGR